MRCAVGIDLGSTTTKSVVLGEDGRILGRGITNSRSNYDVACAVARREAFDDVRRTLCAGALARTELPAADRPAFLERLRRGFQLSQYLVQLGALREFASAELPAVEALFAGSRLGPALSRILDALEAGAPALFAPDAPRRSDFFRDTAASEYHKLAQSIASPQQPFEALLGVFDKAILKVENRDIDIPFAEGAGRAIDRAILQSCLPTRTMAESIRAVLTEVYEHPLEVVASVGTGYGRARLPFPKEQIRSEILCHGLGAHAMFPGTATVLDIGGQDTKAIQVDGDGIVTSFQMNDRCAAGCGRYLGYIADEMDLGLHELSPLAEKSTRPVRITSTCTVFAGAEIRDRLTLGQRREDVLAGLHRAVILRAMALLARSGGVRNELTFTGGVAKNSTAERVLRQLISENYGDITMNVSPDSIYTGALGAALFASRMALAREEAAA
ncbi:MAG: benzoyl-CoA reductase subunit A [Planctomycetes bacterium]|nr:benzoyl-CoA reductase subunit A [Planctomycetota bacterium]